MESDREQTGSDTRPQGGFFRAAWQRLVQFGLGDSVLRVAAMAATVVVILAVVLIMDRFYVSVSGATASELSVSAAEGSLPSSASVPPFMPLTDADARGVTRDTALHTILPLRARAELVSYTVQPGDNLFTVAGKFNLKPETVLWSNRYNLGDDPHMIYPGQQLEILPLDGILHRWSAGEGLNGVAEFYHVTPEDIINYAPNELSMATIGDYANPNIQPGKMLIIPGGTGEFTDWRTPRITREDPATAKNVGPGACTEAYDGVLGTLNFSWPVADQVLSGYDFNPGANHFGIDIGGGIGTPITAADNGVVVYAGWNDWGYGEMVVIDHGKGWQTLYAHMSTVEVTCGEEVYRGDVIGTMGDTGTADGPHLHFELRNDDYGRVNPWDFLQ